MHNLQQCNADDVQEWTFSHSMNLVRPDSYYCSHFKSGDHLIEFMRDSRDFQIYELGKDALNSHNSHLWWNCASQVHCASLEVSENVQSSTAQCRWCPIMNIFPQYEFGPSRFVLLLNSQIRRSLDWINARIRRSPIMHNLQQYEFAPSGFVLSLTLEVQRSLD